MFQSLNIPILPRQGDMTNHVYILTFVVAGRPAGRVMKLTSLPCLIPRLRMLGVTAPLPYQSSRLHALLSTRTTLPLAN